MHIEITEEQKRDGWNEIEDQWCLYRDGRLLAQVHECDDEETWQWEIDGQIGVMPSEEEARRKAEEALREAGIGK